MKKIWVSLYITVLTLVGALSLSANPIEVLLSFTGTNGPFQGTDPKGSMIMSNSMLYGFTSAGGQGNGGIIFSIEPYGGSYKVLASFSTNSTTDSTGFQPHHGLLVLDGETIIRPIFEGGESNNGTIFSVQTNASNPTLNYTFSGSSNSPTALGDGSQPHSGLLEGSGQIYYGITALGGSYGGGIIYAYNASSNVAASNSVTTLYSFSTNTGYDSHGQLTWDSTGTLLLGMTRYGGNGVGNNNTTNSNGLIVPPGVIFSFNPSNAAYTPLYNFTSASNTPYFTDHGFLTRGTGTKETTIYGMTEFGGTYDKGAIFSLSETGSPSLNVLHSFSGTNGGTIDGSHPFGSLVLNTNTGVFYGMTSSGGESNAGTIFCINQDGTGYQILASFDINSGSDPIDNVTLNPSGTMLYGLTQTNGAYGNGTIFALKLVPGTIITNTIIVPLHVIPNGGSQKTGIYLSLGGSTNPQIFTFDTGGKGFVAAYEKNTPWWGTNVSNQINKNVEISYGNQDSGQSVSGSVVTTTVSFFAGSNSTSPILTTGPLEVMQATNIQNTKNNSSNSVWPTNNISTGPWTAGTYGDFGMQIAANSNGFMNILAQLTYSNVTPGFLVHIEPTNSSNPSYVQIGLTPGNLNQVGTVYLPMLAPSNPGYFPGTTNQCFASFLLKANLTLSNSITNWSTNVVVQTDCGGGGSPNIFYASSNEPSELIPLQAFINSSLDGIKPNVLFLLSSSNTNPPLQKANLYNFITSSNSATIEPQGGSNPISINTGIQFFLSNNVSFDLAHGLMGIEAQNQKKPVIPMVAWTVSNKSSNDSYALGSSFISYATNAFGIYPKGTLYQWFRNGIPIRGETNPTLSIEKITPYNAGYYDLRLKESGETTNLGPEILVVSETGLLIYDYSALAVTTTGVTEFNGTVSGYLIMDKASGQSAIVSYGRDRTGAKWQSLQGPTASQLVSNGPVPGSRTLFYSNQPNAFAQGDQSIMWITGRNTLTVLSEKYFTMYPKYASGFIGQLSLGDVSVIDNYNASIRLNNKQTLTARENNETIQDAITRISQSLINQGYQCTP